MAGSNPVTGPPPSRTIRAAIDLSSLRSISSDDLLAMSADEYQAVRRSATRARIENTVAYACPRCGHGVYAPREWHTGRPFWKHHGGAPTDCPWWTGTPLGVDDVSARQFQGAQESPLHVAAKTVIGELLAPDIRTEPGSVVVDRCLTMPDGRRRPDVRAVHGGHPLAVEVQLATTQIPIIVQRENFYGVGGYHMLWVTCDFRPPPPGGRLPSSFEDILHSHGKNIFSLDAETIALSRMRRVFMTIALSRMRRVFILRVFWRRDGAWASEPVAVSGLSWLPGGLGNAVPPERPWNERLLARWRSVTDEHGTPWEHREAIVDELSTHIGLPRMSGKELSQAVDLVNCLLSLAAGHPVGSRQGNLVEVVNTFLAVERRHRFARLVHVFAELCGRRDTLASGSVRAKMAKAMSVPQAGQATAAGRLALGLFPEVFARREGAPRSSGMR